MSDERKTLDEELVEQLKINEADLNGELINHATRYFYWGSMWARAIKQERTQKLNVEAMEADLAKDFRLRMSEEDPTTRVTEKLIKEYISSNPSYKEAYAKLIHLGYMADLFGVAKNAFESRGRILVELAKISAGDKFYENEVINMKNEFERREEEKAEKKKRRKPTIESTVDAIDA